MRKDSCPGVLQDRTSGVKPMTTNAEDGVGEHCCSYPIQACIMNVYSFYCMTGITLCTWNDSMQLCKTIKPTEVRCRISCSLL